MPECLTPYLKQRQQEVATDKDIPASDDPAWLDLNDLPGEEWRDIEGFEGLYQVSSLGRVKSLARVARNGRPIRARIRVQTPQWAGYLQMTLSKVGVHQQIAIAREVAKAFVPNPEGKPQVNHIDGNRQNNAAANLEWVTCSENNLHSYRELGRKHSRPTLGKRGRLHHASRPVVGMALDGSAELRFESIALSKTAGFLPSCVWRCCAGLQRKHRGYRWRYA